MNIEKIVRLNSPEDALALVTDQFIRNYKLNQEAQHALTHLLGAAMAIGELKGVEKASKKAERTNNRDDGSSENIH
jgi:hypothetical protein